MAIAQKMVEGDSQKEKTNRVSGKSVFIMHKNRDAKRFEFTPKLKGFTSYMVSYDEVGSDVDKAWEALQNALNNDYPLNNI